MRTITLYTAARLAVLVATAAVLALFGLRGFLLAALAVVISLPASYLLLARQRSALAADVERRLADRRDRRADLRSQLRGDDGSSPADGGIGGPAPD